MSFQRFFGFCCSFLLFAPPLCAASPVEISGVVTDRARQPIAQAEVRLVPNRIRYLLPSDIESFNQTRTDSRGHFTLSADVPDTMPLALLASAPGHRLARFPLDRTTLHRRIGLALDPGATLRGKVSDPQGDPVAGALLGPLTAARETDRVTAERLVPQWATTAADGTFQFEGIMPGLPFYFSVQAPGYGLAEIAVPAGTPEVSFQLQPGGATISGAIVARGKPSSEFSGMKVRLSGQGLDCVFAADPQGQFTISGIPSGEFSLEPVPGEGRAATVALVSLPEADGTSWTLEVSSGYSVSGMVIDAETSTPAPAVAIRGIGAEPGYELDARSGSDGRFLLGPFYQVGLPALQVLPESGFVAVSDLGEVMDLPMGADGFTDVSGVELKVRRRRDIAVTLENFSETTQPVAVSLLGPPRSHAPARTSTTTSSLDIPVYTAGTYSVWAAGGGVSTRLQAVEVAQQGRVPVALQLDQAASVAGQVRLQTRDGGTTRPAGFSVRVLLPETTTATSGAEPPPPGSVLAQERRASRTLSENADLAPDGSFLFPLLPSGRFVVQAQNSSGSRQTDIAVTLEHGVTTRADFLFPPGKNLSGRVLTSDNRPIPMVSLRLYLRGGEAGGGLEMVIEADEMGFFRAEDLQAEVLESLSIDTHGFQPKRIGPLPLPLENIQIVLHKRGLLRAKVDASASSDWKVYLMSAEPWRRGTHPEQLMSRPAEAPVPVAGGEEAELKVPGSGRYRVVAAGSSGRAAVSEPFTWSPNDDTDRQIVLVPDSHGSITGTYDGTGAAEVTAWNTALPEAAGLTAEFKVDAQAGRFSFPSVPPGDYLVIAAGDSTYASAANVQVAPGATASVALETDSGGAPVHGIVRTGDRPLPGAQMELISQTDPAAPVRRTRSSNEGTFKFETVPADEYLVSAVVKTEGGEMTGQRSVTVTRRGEAPSVDIDIQPRAKVFLRAAELSRLGITGGIDVFFSEKQRRDLTKARALENGDYEIEVEAGSYEVWRGDEPVGSAEVTREGAVTLSLPSP